MRAGSNLPNLINETSACSKTRFYVKFKSADVLRLFERFLIFEENKKLKDKIGFPYYMPPEMIDKNYN